MGRRSISAGTPCFETGFFGAAIEERRRSVSRDPTALSFGRAELGQKALKILRAGFKSSAGRLEISRCKGVKKKKKKQKKQKKRQAGILK